MLEEILHTLKNWFDVVRLYGSFDIQQGKIYHSGEPIDFREGQYYRIIGSVYNDGLHQSYDAIQDEHIQDGSVWILAIPPRILKLADEITAWQTKNGAPGQFQSESFAGYSYTRATNKDGSAVTWEDAFRTQLRQWRKL